MVYVQIFKLNIIILFSGYSYKSQDIGYRQQALDDDFFKSPQAFKTPAKQSEESGGEKSQEMEKRTSRSEDEKYYGCYRTQHIECTDTVTTWQVITH